MGSDDEWNGRGRLPDKFPVHINLRAGRVRRNHYGSRSARITRSSRIAGFDESRRLVRVNRPDMLRTRMNRSCYGLEVQLKMIGTQDKILPMLLAGQTHPFQRSVGQGHLLQ